ncbi:ATP-binding protein [Marinobacterium sp. BA1]|uniref:ATP-binding protein n=1 Tax=Marinobacterium sp. BA1 TaxID=3138931 RepID=UPI0034E84A12
MNTLKAWCNRMPFLSRLSRRVTMGYLIAMVVTLILAWVAVALIIRPMIVEQKQRTLNDNQQVIFAYLDARLAEVGLLSQTMAGVVAADAGSDLAETLLPILLRSRQGDFVVGGGFWPARSGSSGADPQEPLFWGYVDGEFQRVHGYKDDPLGYWSHYWYTVVSPPKMNKSAQCEWSAGYTDPFTQMRMITCSVAMYDAADAFLGVVTVDVGLEDIRRSLNEFAQRRDGYALVFDQAHRIISYPDEKFKRFTKPDCDCPEADDVLRAENTWLNPVFEHLDSGGGIKGLTRIGPLDDQIMNAASVMYVYHYEALGWDMAFAIPEQAEVGLANLLLKQMMVILGVSLTVMWFIAMVYSREFTLQVRNTIQAMREQIKGDRQPIPVERYGEIGKLQSVINEYAETLYTAHSEVDRYKQTNEELERFSSAAAHDIRQQLISINTYLHFLRKKAGGRLNDDEHSLLQHVFKSVIRLDAILRDLLTYARVGGVRPPVTESFCSRDALEEVMSLLTFELSEIGADVRIQSGPWPLVMSQPSDLLRLFQNLVQNAIKYRAGHTLVLNIQWKPSRAPGFVTFIVMDNGMGIEPENLEWVFEPFTRQSEEKEGTGIGLAICHKIVTHLGGSIRCYSNGFKTGTRFEFDWPSAGAHCKVKNTDV